MSDAEKKKDAEDELVIDTSKMSAGKKDALEIAELSRQKDWKLPSFAAELFMGRFLPELVFPFPTQPPAEKAEGDALVDKVRDYLAANLDPDEVDATREIPKKVIADLFEMGLFAMKAPREYDGLGLSQVNYNRVMMMISSFCGSTAVLLSAHQSIGVPQPLKMFGTPEQKKKFYPRFRTGTISAFGLTEPGVGSDPAKMTTKADLSEDGSYYVLNGVKQWCTNSPVADLLIVMARTKPKLVRGKERPQVTAFIVEKNSPGVELIQRCDFMGLAGMQNGNLRFTNVKVPLENMIGGEGGGLKLALTTLNTGRLTLPAACVGMAKQCLSIARRWGNKREQWGQPVGRHEAGQEKIAFIASTTFAMEAVTMLSSHYVDKKNTDIRIEAAMAKYFCSEYGWRIVDMTMQLRGGRGYEKARSLQFRGDEPYPVERMMRDARINTIIEGTSEIMRLFLAREVLDKHLSMAKDMIKPGTPIPVRILAFLKLTGFYAFWYPRQWLSWLPAGMPADMGSLGCHVRYVARTGHRLARELFHIMVRYQDKLDQRQIILGHLINAGTELFVMAATCSFAVQRAKEEGDDSPMELADLYCREARRRIAWYFHSLWHHDNRSIGAVAKRVSDGAMKWLEKDVVWIGPRE